MHCQHSDDRLGFARLKNQSGQSSNDHHHLDNLLPTTQFCGQIVFLSICERAATTCHPHPLFVGQAAMMSMKADAPSCDAIAGLLGLRQSPLTHDLVEQDEIPTLVLLAGVRFDSLGTSAAIHHQYINDCVDIWSIPCHAMMPPVYW
jgi:hypothetical protein